MTCRAGSAGFIPRVSRNAAHEAVRKALRAFVGTGRPWSVKMLANEAGVKPKVIECATYEAGSEHWRALPFHDLLAIAAVLGAEFTAACLRPAGHGAFELPHAAALDPAALMIEKLRLANEVVAIAADNDLCADDLVKMLPIAHAGLDLNLKMLAAHAAGIQQVAA